MATSSQRLVLTLVLFDNLEIYRAWYMDLLYHALMHDCDCRGLRRGERVRDVRSGGPRRDPSQYQVLFIIHAARAKYPQKGAKCLMEA